MKPISFQIALYYLSEIELTEQDFQSLSLKIPPEELETVTKLYYYAAEKDMLKFIRLLTAEQFETFMIELFSQKDLRVLTLFNW